MFEMFNNQEQIKKFINGYSFNTEEKEIKEVEDTTKKECEVQIFYFDAVANLNVSNRGTAQTTVPGLSIAEKKDRVKDFSRFLLDFREDFRLSQKECGDILGLSVGTIQNIENNNFNRNRDTTLRLITLMNLSKMIKSNVKQKYILRTIFHSKMGLFGNRTALEFILLLPEEKRLNELVALLTKIYE